MRSGARFVRQPLKCVVKWGTLFRWRCGGAGDERSQKRSWLWQLYSIFGYYFGVLSRPAFVMNAHLSQIEVSTCTSIIASGRSGDANLAAGASALAATFSPTQKQMDVLRYVAGYIEVNAAVPTLSNIAKAYGHRCRSGIQRLIGGLVERGFVSRCSRISRGIEVLRPPVVPRDQHGEPLFFVRF